MEALFENPSFWVGVSFFIFIFAIGKMVWAKATAALDARAEEIRTKLDEATKLREEAQSAKANFERLQRDAFQEAESILNTAKAEAERLRKEAEEKLQASIERREQSVLEKIQNAENKAMQEVRNQMVDLAVAATERLIADNIDDATRKRLASDAISEIPTRLQ